MKKRGQKSQLPLVERLLLTFTYLRHYSTFAMLGDEFGIRESDTNKIYHQMLDVLVKVLPMKSREHLLDSDLETIVIDVTEQSMKIQQYDSVSNTAVSKNCTRLRFRQLSAAKAKFMIIRLFQS